MNVEFKKVSGIYKISSLVDGKFYIGSAISLYTRWHHHKHNLLNNKHSNGKLQRFVNKHGILSIKIDIVEICEKEQLLQREQFYIDTLKPFFNICKVAGNTLGVKHTEDTKEKLSIMRKGKPTIGMLGKKHTQQTKDLIAEKAKNRGISKSFMDASIVANTGRTHTKEHRDIISQKQRKISDEQVNEIKDSLSKGIKQIDLAIKYGVSQRVISRVKNGIGIYGVGQRLF